MGIRRVVGDGALAPPTPIGGRGTVDIAFVVPRSGPAGIYGPSCEVCGTLAVEEVNAGGGLLGRQVRLRVVDGGRAPDAVAAEVGTLVDRGAVDAVAGWHVSAVRRAIDPMVSGRVPYFYSPLHEGGERTPGVFLTGETPERQLVPALRWMADELGVTRWFAVGNDDARPRASTRVARALARRSPGVRVLGEAFVPLGTHDFDEVLLRTRRSGAQGVLVFLVGTDAVAFHRGFARAGLARRLVRLCPLMDENVLLAVGSENAHGLYAVAGYFEALTTPSARDFAVRYARRFGPSAPVLNSPGESCYEGIALFGRLVARAGSLQLTRLVDAARSFSYDSPRGRVRMEGDHLRQRAYLARADGLRLEVLLELPERPDTEG